MPKKDKPPQWYNVYEGNDEANFFRCLGRIEKYKWRSTSALATETGLTKSRVEEIVLKYLYDGRNPLGMVMQSPTNEDHWGYWERVPELLKDIPDSISKADKDQRINKALVRDDTLQDRQDYPYPDGYIKSLWIKIDGPDDVDSAIAKAKEKQLESKAARPKGCYMSPHQSIEYLRDLESW